MKTQTCGICQIANVRLYRPYGNYFRSADNRCNIHLDDNKIDWYVPLFVNSEDDSIWGYNAVPYRDLEYFYNLPEADPTGISWVGISVLIKNEITRWLPKNYKLEDLPRDIADQIKESKMDPKHDHLNELLDD